LNTFFATQWRSYTALCLGCSLVALLEKITETTRKVLDVSDEVDLANDLAEAALQSSLSQINLTPEAAETGKCLYCDEPVIGRRWCDATCTRSWEEEKRRGK
jgi:hypothetical protein